jgi:hypothetical protein
MNRRSIIKNGALAASAALLGAREVTPQPRRGKPKPLETVAARQGWRYKMVSARQVDLDQAGKEMWEAVGIIESNLILFKQPA